MEESVLRLGIKEKRQLGYSVPQKSLLDEWDSICKPETSTCWGIFRAPVKVEN